MAFNNSPGRAEYTATAGQTVFTYVFKIYDEADIKVYLTPAGQVADDAADLLTITTDYTVVITGDVGGTVTLVVPASIGDSITLVRVLDIDRIIEYQTNGDLLADTLNQDQNYQTYLIADKESDNTRFLKLPESTQGVSTEIPPPTPLNFFQWNAAGDAIINVASLQADGFIWTAADVYTKTETNTLLNLKVNLTDYNEKSKLWDAQTNTHDFTTDADYTLTSAQNAYGRIILTDTGVVLTAARSIITDDIEKSLIVQNNTLQDITVKTLLGTGILILPGQAKQLHNDATNIINLLGPLDGVSYVDPDAIGTSPTAKIYPDGTIVGSTSNGNYTKSPNGDLLMTTTLAMAGPTTAGGSNFYSASTVWTYPIAAVSGIYVSGSNSNSVYWMVGGGSANNLSSAHRVTYGASSATASTAYMTGVGRWK